MRIKSIKNNKKGNPKEITVVMSVDEAGVITKVLGRITGTEFDAKFPNLSNTDVLHEIYSCMTGEFFNKTWDDGVEDWHRGVKPNIEEWE
jgi:hypothetical protein